MAKKPKRKKETQPTLFVLEGAIRYYDDGSMLQLHTQITDEEWRIIVEETIKYKIFVEGLKEVAIPILKETWDEDDDWFRIQLDVAVSRMRNIDPLLVASFNQEEISASYKKSMAESAPKMVDMIKGVREAQKEAMMKQLEDDGIATRVSDL